MFPVFQCSAHSERHQGGNPQRDGKNIEGKDLKFQGPFVRLKVFLRKLFGGNTEKCEFEKELLAAGWSEKARVRIQTVNRYVGVYRKAAQAGRVELGD